MRIKTFCKFLDVSEVVDHSLKDTPVVIDGQNFLYRTYKDFKLPYEFGCEGDRYASKLKEYLSMFQNANVQCYFVFKGGNEDVEKKIQNRSKRMHGKDFVVGETFNDIVIPLFTKSVYLEVLTEMGFKYVICEQESKKECIALAQQLNCPVLSYDIEFCFSGVQYIPTSYLHFDPSKNSIRCKTFSLQKFLQKYNLTEEKIALFIVLTDELIFPENFFLPFFQQRKMAPPLGCFKRNLKLLAWLSRNNRDTILSHVFKYLDNEERKAFAEAENKARDMINRKEDAGVAARCVMTKSNATITRNDPLWLQKGIALNHVALDYVNLYRSKTFIGSHSIEDTEQDDSTILTLQIIKYAYDLLTNFQNEGFSLICNNKAESETLTVADEYSIRQPTYEASGCVFEDGWDHIRELGLFEHFLEEALGAIDLKHLDKLPEETRLLVIALVFFSRKKARDSSSEVVCVLLSYVMLDVVLHAVDRDNLPRFPFAEKPIKDSSTDKSKVAESDCYIAAAIMADYFNVSKSDVVHIFDRKLLHPLVEFQQCLRQLNDLNKLCGTPYRPTVISRTYNGTLVYQLLHAMKKNGEDYIQFLENMLCPAPTVYAFMNGILEVYEEIL